MDGVDIRVFQAAATAIPALLIALVIGQRVNDPRQTDDPGIYVGMSVVVGVLAFAGEVSALAALADGTGSRWQLWWVAIAIVGLIVLIIMVSATPALHMRYGSKAFTVTSVLYMLMFLYGTYVIMNTV